MAGSGGLLGTVYAIALRRTISLRGSLTEKELWIARLVASGLRNSEIANMLSIGEKAVKANLTKIFRKLGLKSRVQLVLLFWRKDLSDRD